MKREKIAVLREGLLALTGNVNAAIILNQFIYWAECKAEADKMYAKELAAFEREGGETDFKPSYGWIYKSSAELSDETMLGLSPSNIRRFIKQLIEKGFIVERRNPQFKWDRTLQYNVNLKFIQVELRKLGYALAGYTLDESEQKNESNDLETPFSKIENQNSDLENQNVLFEKAIPKITTEITTKSSNKERENIIAIQKQDSLSNVVINNGVPKSQEDMERQEHYFKLFWEAYPRKANQYKARIAWEVVPIDISVYGNILRAVEAYSKSEQWKDKLYVPYPEKFLNERRWEDELPTETPTASRKTGVAAAAAAVKARLRGVNNG